MNILTGYTIAMTHQTKTVVDAAKKTGVQHIANRGVFAAEDATESKYCWFALAEAYIRASGIACGSGASIQRTMSAPLCVKTSAFRPSTAWMHGCSERSAFAPDIVLHFTLEVVGTPPTGRTVS
jgi:hypothetical protein